MTDVTNALDPFFLGNASQNDDTTAPVNDGLDPADSTWHLPNDNHYSSRGLNTRRFFRTDIMPAISLKVISCHVTFPAGSATAEIIWDVGSDGAGTNLAFGGYGLQVNGRNFEFLWRDEGAASPSVLLTYDIDTPEPHYPPLGTKKGIDYVVTVALVKTERRHYASLLIDSFCVATRDIPTGEQVSVNEAAGITLWGTARAPGEAACSKVLNGTNTGFRTSSFYAKNFYNKDARNQIAKLSGSHVLTRQAQPAAGA